MSLEPTPERDQEQDFVPGAPASDFNSAIGPAVSLPEYQAVPDMVIESHFYDFAERVESLAKDGLVVVAIDYARDALPYYAGNFETHIRCMLLNAHLSALISKYKNDSIRFMEHAAEIIKESDFPASDAVADFAIEYFTVFSKLARTQDLVDFLEPLLENMNESVLARDDRIRLLRGRLGTYYMQIGKIEYAESHLLHSVRSAPEDGAMPDPVSQIGRLRLGQYFRVNSKPELALPLLRQAEEFFLSNIANSYNPQEVVALGVEAALALISIQTTDVLQSGITAVSALYEKLDFLEQVAERYLPEQCIELSNIEMLRVDIQRQLGFRDTIQSDMLEILRAEIDNGRADGAAANGARMLLGSTAAGSARIVHRFYEELHESSGIPVGVSIPTGNPRPLSAVLNFARDLDLENPFKRFLPSNPPQGEIEAQEMFTAFRSVIADALDRAVHYYEEFLHHGCSAKETEIVLTRIHDLYRDLNRPREAAAVEQRIKKIRAVSDSA
jgi:tetratricopeptide (TPR) repeat protein